MPAAHPMTSLSCLKTARWLSIPASSLVASGAAGAASAVLDGCVISDRGLAANVRVRLPNGTWNVFNVTARLKAVAPVNASAAMSILVGDADILLLMQTLHAPGGASKLPEVY